MNKMQGTLATVVRAMVLAIAAVMLAGSIQADAKSVFRYSRGAHLESRSIYGQTATAGYDLWSNVAEPLVRLNFQTLEIEPMLAESWQVEAEGTVWVFYLREGVRFHDGSTLTAADVVHSFDRMLNDPDSRQPEAWTDVERIEVRDDMTVAFHLSQPRPDFDLQIRNRYITSKAAYEEHGPDRADHHPSGTGPYKLKEWRRGSYIGFERFEDYWNATDEPMMDEIVYLPITEKAAAIAGLEAGTIDLVDAIPPHEVDRLQSRRGIRIESAPSSRMMFFVLNPGHKPLDDVRVRRAIHHAIDVDRIIATVLEGRAYRVWQAVPEGVFGFNDSLQPYEYDPAKARQLLAEAGYPDGFDLEFWTPSGRYPGDLDTSIAATQMLREVGINVDLKTPEWGIFSSTYKTGEIPMYLIGRGSVPEDPARYLYQYFETGVTDRILYSNPEIDSLFEKSRTEFDVDLRRSLLEEAVGLIHEAAIQLPLYNPQDNYAVREWVDWTADSSEYVEAALRARPRQE